MIAALGIAVGLVSVAKAQGAVTRFSDVVYLKEGGAAFTMDVFKPEKSNGAAVFFILSGGWASNHRDISPQAASVFTTRGMTVFEVVHGTQPRYQLPDIVRMVNRAVRYGRANADKYGVDPNRFGVWGGSAGGHLSLMIAGNQGAGDPAAADPVDRVANGVQAVAAFFPPTDLLNYGKEGVRAFDVPALRVFWPAFGITTQTPQERLVELAKAYSPIEKISAKFPPTLLIHGDADTLVPLQQSEIFADALKKAGGTVQLVVKPKGGHGWPDIAVDTVKIADWFEKYLVPKG